MKVILHTLGCKLNQLETEALASSFRRQGFYVEDSKSNADIYILNSCTVTSRSDQKGRKWLRRVSKENPDALIIATGCYAELEPEVVSSLGKNIYIVRQEMKDKLLLFPRYLKEHLHDAGSKKQLLEKFLKEKDGVGKNQFGYFLLNYNFHTRAFLKIQDGCDYRCTYCRVPLARGSSVSLESSEVLKRFSLLEEAGYREIVLTGVNLNAYDDGKCDFPCLLERIVGRGGRARIRLSSLEPEKVDSRLISVVKEEVVCPYFHLSVQSGSDKILSRMRRRYNSERVERAAESLRAAKGDPFIAADIIVGFPGEREEDFRKTYQLLERIGFAKVHVFPYSGRPGTEAYLFKEHVPERVRDERVQKILRLSERMKAEYVKRWKGKRVSLLVEKIEGDVITGVTENYLKMSIKRRELRCQRGDLIDIVL